MKKSIILIILVTLNFFGLKAQIAWPQNGSNIYYNGGSVGIGTMNPNSILTTVANGRNLSLYSNSTINNNAILFDTYDNLAQKIFSDFNGSNSEQSLILGTYTNRNNQLTLHPNGNIGIGTTTPPYKLVVSNAGGLGLELDPSGVQYNEGFGMQVYNRSTSNYQPLQIYASKILLNGGNVGIGTTSPKALLDIGKYQMNSLVSVLARLPEGDSQGEGTYLGIRSLNTSPAYSNSFSIEHKFYGEINSSINFFRGGSVDGGFLTFNTSNNTEQMRITSSGNVGIGITNPLYKLAVNGTIAAREVKVTAEVWADFVFHPTYKLRTLGEVEQFIKNNSHLPEIPTAAEVKENGVSLGEMNAKLLQKMEELTLYLIEQNKKIENQNEKILDLEKRIDEITVKH